MSNKKTKNSFTALIDTHVSVVGRIVDFLSQQHEEYPNRNSLLISSQQQTELIESWLSLSEFSFPTLLDSLKDLPIIYILPDTDNLKLLIDQKKLLYQARAEWLKAILLENSIGIKVDYQDDFSNRSLEFISVESILPSSNELPKFSSNLPLDILNRSFPLACLSKAIFDLATVTYPNSNDLKTLFPSIEALWVCCEFSTSRFNTREMGVMGLPVIRSKRQTTEYITEFTKNLEETEITQQKTVASKNLAFVDRSEHLIDLLLNESARLYKDSSLDDSIYEKAFRLFKRLNNLARNDSAYQLSYILPNDQIFTTKQNNKIPKDFAAPQWKRRTEKEVL